MATDYIKRIQSNLSGKKIKLGRPAIREELELLGYSNETLTDELAMSVINTLVSKFGGGAETKLLPDYEPNNEPISEPTNVLKTQELETSQENIDTDLDTFSEIHLITDTNCSEEIETVTESTTLSTEPEKNIETGIIVSSEEKHDLVTAQSSVLDVQLSELETIELCSQIPDIFDDYKSFVDSVTSAIKAFVDDKFDHQETQTVDDSISELRQHIANRQARLDSKFSQGLSEVKGDLEQIRSNIKSRQSAILERFRIPAKT